MKQTHIMLDLETWGTTPGSDIRSIGACVFDPQTGTGDPRGGETDTRYNEAQQGNPYLFYRACDNPETPDDVFPRRYALTRDPQTVQWWSEQSVEAQGAFNDPIDLKQALIDFYLWLTVAVPDTIMGEQVKCRVWSHGANFDPPLLEAAWRACQPMHEYLNLHPSPWHYRSPRDTRTLFDAAGIEDHSGWLDRYEVGTTHHALDDAICQARAVCAAFERLRGAGAGGPLDGML